LDSEKKEEKLRRRRNTKKNKKKGCVNEVSPLKSPQNPLEDDTRRESRQRSRKKKRSVLRRRHGNDDPPKDLNLRCSSGGKKELGTSRETQQSANGWESIENNNKKVG